VQAFRWVGWLFLVFGAFFAFATVVERGDGAGVVIPFSILAGLFLLGGLSMVGVAAGSRAMAGTKAVIAASGLAGTATITGVELTGVRINDNPRCRITVNVSLPGRLIYQATVTEVIPQLALSRYEAGSKFPCRVAPDDLSKVVLIDDTGVARGSSAAVLASGIEGIATVRRTFDPPPATDIDQPLWGLDLRVVVPDGRPAYDIRLATVYPAGLRQPGKGARLAVRVDPEEPRRVAVDWAGGAAAPAIPADGRADDAAGPAEPYDPSSS
jgi:hypothetical protein